MPKPELKFNKLKATYLMLALCAILAIGSYGWNLGLNMISDTCSASGQVIKRDS